MHFKYERLLFSARCIRERILFVYLPVALDSNLRRFWIARRQMSGGPEHLWERLISKLTFAALDCHFAFASTIEQRRTTQI